MYKKYVFINILFMVALVLNVLKVHSQEIIVYSYDVSGNRTGRVLNLGGMLKSAYLDENKEEDKQKTSFHDDVLIWPNPSEGMVNIYINHEYEGIVYLRIYDAGGTLLHEKKYESIVQEIDLYDLPTGIYLLKVVMGEKSYTRKIIKK